MTPQIPNFLALVAVVAFFPTANRSVGEEPASPGETRSRIVYNRDIRPLLSNQCFQCHGPDANRREADLRLDSLASVTEDRGGYAVIIPGNAEGSELYRRITSHTDERMPPDSGSNSLTAGEIDLLKQWIDEGAAWQSQWAFRPPQKPRLPEVVRAPWPANEIDYFILQRLEQAGLEPAPPADRRTLIRRLSLDLTGLPPSPEEISAFINDPRGDAYERLVERLLASPHFGERMALAWMDAARYGDTSVFHADGPRDMWPWRNWVISAYNANMPFDQFTREQLAGDLLPDASGDQRIATGFNRNHGTTDEGGAIAEEYRVEYVVDRVRTTSMVWLGLTLECAQCHEHKYEPITQQEYYQFYAFFNQTKDTGLQTRNGNAAPLIQAPSSRQRHETARLTKRIETFEENFARLTPPRADIEAWADELTNTRSELRSAPTVGPWHAVGPFSGANAGDAFSHEFVAPTPQVDLLLSYGEQSWQLRPDWQDGTVVKLSLPNNSAIYLARTITSEAGEQVDIALGSDDTISVWLNGDQLLAKEVYRGAAADQDRATLALRPGENWLLLKITNGSGDSGFYFNMGDREFPQPVVDAVFTPRSPRTAEDNEILQAYYKEQVSPEGQRLQGERDEAKRMLGEVQREVPTVMIMEDLETPRETYLLSRGHYASPVKDEAIWPDTPDCLPPMPPQAPRNRLGLAQWLIQPGHPLTARVAVNRYWMMLFGSGIVTTAADFGSQGAWPTHPALLDYLACDYVDSGWDTKRLLKQIVMSSTYRQASRATRDALQKDPLNRWLSHAPRLRLQAEFLRDQALAASGLLNREIGGPGVKPFQPPGLWNEVSLSTDVRFTQDRDAQQYRRGMYIYWKRSAPAPNMLIFDAPTRERCVVQRQRTNTPLQALVTLNDPQFAEASRALAQRVLQQERKDTAQRINGLFELATGHTADALRQQVFAELLQAELNHFRQNRDAAQQLLTVGDSPRNEELDVAEHAAWTVLASGVLNLDETLNRE